MVICLCKVYNTVDEYACAEMSPNLCSAAQLEEHVNGGKVRWSCAILAFWSPEFRCSRPIRLQHPSYYIPLLSSCFLFKRFCLKITPRGGAIEENASTLIASGRWVFLRMKCEEFPVVVVAAHSLRAMQISENLTAATLIVLFLFVLLRCCRGKNHRTLSTGSGALFVV